MNRKVFQVTVPPHLCPGIGLQIDGGGPEAGLRDLLPDRCVAEVPLSDQLVACSRGWNGLASVSQNQQNPVKVTLKGFTGAYDGAPLQLSDIEDRQKKLQDFVSKNNEDCQAQEEQERRKPRTDPAGSDLKQGLAPRFCRSPIYAASVSRDGLGRVAAVRHAVEHIPQLRMPHRLA